MHIVHVTVQVKPEHSAEFVRLTLDNARNSAHEAGVLRFDVVRAQRDATRFVLVEIYKTVDDQRKHRETAHYLRWRDAVADMMAAPRAAELFDAIVFSDASLQGQA
jgi:(4S)-4-hydroxy-5-phosphonooxypentane-2,3-dione isomerase